jgi:hypothetical protein
MHLSQVTPICSIRGYGKLPADLFLSNHPGTGTWDFAVGLKDDDLGNIYKNPQVKTTVDFFGENGGVVCGGAWDQNDPKQIPVRATSAAEANLASVVWTAIDINDPHHQDAKYQVAVNLSALGQYGLNLNNFEFLWTSATCANDVIKGQVFSYGQPVPVPPTAVLLGSGLAGLAFWRRRRMAAKS